MGGPWQKSKYLKGVNTNDEENVLDGLESEREQWEEIKKKFKEKLP